MTEEFFSVVDRDYGSCLAFANPRKIRTKSSSFESIGTRFNNFRVQLLRKGYEEGQVSGESGVTDDYVTQPLVGVLGDLDDSVELLSMENLPSTYLGRRALKLRNHMFHNLNHKCGGYYSLVPEMDEMDVVPGLLDETQGTIGSDLEQSADPDEIEEYNAGGSLHDSVIDESLGDQSSIPEIVEVTSVVDDQLVNGQQAEDDTYDQDDSVSEMPVIVSSDSGESAFTSDAISDAINAEIRKIKVSHNQSNTARISHFDEQGQVRKKTNRDVDAIIVGKSLTPFSLPHVSFKTAFVPFSQTVENDNHRDFPVVVPERNESTDVSVLSGQNDKTGIVEGNSRLAEFSALRDKYVVLQQKREAIKKMREDAQRKAEDAASRALETQERLKESEKSVEESVALLRTLTDEMEEDYNKKMKSIELVNNDAQMNNNFIAIQSKKIEMNNQFVQEIQSMLASGEVSSLSEENKKRI